MSDMSRRMEAWTLTVTSVLFLVTRLVDARTNLSLVILHHPDEPISDESVYHVTDQFVQARFPFFLDLQLSPPLNTEFSLLHYVSSLTCDNASVLLVTSPCKPGVLDSLQLAQVPTVIMVQQPTCIHGNRPWPDHVMYYPAFLTVSDVVCGLIRERYETVVVVYDETVEAHITALEACARSPTSLISTFSVGADPEDYLAVISRADLAVPTTYTQVALVVLWTSPNTSMAILQEVSRPLAELYATGVVSRWLMVCDDPECPDMLATGLPSLSVDFVAMLHVQEPDNLPLNTLQQAVTYIGLAIEDLYYGSGFQFNISSCDNSSLTSHRNHQITRSLALQRFSAGNRTDCEFYSIYTTDIMTHTLDMPTSLCPEQRRSGPNIAFLADVDLFPTEGNTLAGKHISVTTIKSAPFVMTKTKNTTIEFYGMAVDMLLELSITLNFTYTMSLVPDSQFGGLSADGVNWTGMVGQLQRKEVDMSVASLSVTSSRDTVMDFVDYYYEYGSGLMKKTAVEEKKWRVILLPFSGYVWLCLVLAIPLAGIIAWLLSLLVTAAHKTDSQDFSSIFAALWYTFGAVFTQGGPRLPHSSSGRTFVCSWWAFCIVIVASYGGSLIAYLTISKSDTPPFDDLEGLVKQSRYKWGVKEGTVYHSAFREAQGGVYKDLWDGLQKFAEDDPGVESKDTNYQYERVMQGDYVYLTDRTPLTVQMISDKSCSLVMLSETFMPLPFGIGIQEGSRHKATLQRAVKKLRHSGLLQFWDRKWWPKQTCSGIPLPESHAVSLMDAQSAFYLLLTGMVAAMVTLVIEHVIRTATRTKRASVPETVFDSKWIGLQSRYSAFTKEHVINTIADGRL